MYFDLDPSLDTPRVTPGLLGFTHFYPDRMGFFKSLVEINMNNVNTPLY